MKKKPPRGTRFPVSNSGPHKAVPNWRKVPEQDLWLYARSFHKAARTLAGSLQLAPNPFADFDVAPVVFMYRHAVELHLKRMFTLSGHALPGAKWLLVQGLFAVTAASGA